MQCLGRLTSEADSLPFEDGRSFYLERRCENAARKGCTLCIKCTVRDVRTRGCVIGDVMVRGTLDAVLHGKVDEPIPAWSPLFDGPWFHKQIKLGATVSPETMVRAKKAKVEIQAPGPIDKFVCEQPARILPAEKEEAPPPPPAVKKPVVKRTKKTVIVTPPMPAALARVEGSVVEPTEVLEIRVRPFEHDGHSYYIAPTGKLYSKQLKYVGRWNNRENRIDTYPDSD